jgi:DegV family protein with EDD domain
MDSTAFFNRLARSKILPATSMPSPGDFKLLYEDIAKTHDVIISIHLSENLSGTYQSAKTAAAEISGVDVIPIDSKQVSAGLFLLVHAAAQAAARGAGKEEILKLIEDSIRKLKMFFVVDTLEYLQRGGRLSLAGQMIGGMLNVKPILTIKDGVIASASRARSTKKAFQKVMDHLSSLPIKPTTAVVGHALAPEECKKAEAMLRAKFGAIKIFTCEIGPVIGTHSGPGCVEIAVL